MSKFVIKCKVTGNLVDDLDDVMGVHWTEEYSDAIVFQEGKRTDKNLSWFGLNDHRYFTRIYLEG